MGYTALALTDECSVAGVVRAHTEAKKLGLKLLLGAEFAVSQAPGAAGLTVIVLAHHLAGWGDLCEFITHARRSAPKGQYRVDWTDAPWHLLKGCEVLLVMPPAITIECACAINTGARGLFGPNVWLAVELRLGPDDALQLQQLPQLSRLTGVPLVAAGDVHMHVRSRKPLQDVLTAVRRGMPVAACGFALQPNAERHLRPRPRWPRYTRPDWLANTLVIAQRCHFTWTRCATTTR